VPKNSDGYLSYRTRQDVDIGVSKPLPR